MALVVAAAGCGLAPVAAELARLPLWLRLCYHGIALPAVGLLSRIDCPLAHPAA